MEIKTLKLKDIKIGENVRKTDTESIAFKELKENIKQIGLINPLTVCKFQKHFSLVSGYSRYYALKELGFEEVPVNVLSFASNDARIEITRFSENIHRADLTPIEEARMLYTLGKNHPTEDLIILTGKSKAYIRERIKIMELSKEIIQGIEDEKISISAAALLTRVDKVIIDETIDALSRMEIGETMISISDIKERIELNSCNLSQAKFDKTKCRTCDYNSESQIPLFECMTTDDARCGNEECFEKCGKEYIEKQLKEFEKKNYKILEKQSDVFNLKHICNDEKNIPKNCNKRAVWLNPHSEEFQFYCYDIQNCKYHVKDYRKNPIPVQSAVDEASVFEAAEKFTQRFYDWRDKFLKYIITQDYYNQQLIFFPEPFSLAAVMLNTEFDGRNCLIDIEIIDTKSESGLSNFFDKFLEINSIEDYYPYKHWTFNNVLNFVNRIGAEYMAKLEQKVIENIIDKKCPPVEAFKFIKENEINIAEHNPVCKEMLETLDKETLGAVAAELKLPDKIKSAKKTEIIKAILETGKTDFIPEAIKSEFFRV